MAITSGSTDASARNTTPLLIADGDIATTQLLERVLRASHGSVETRYPSSLFGVDVNRRHLAFSRMCMPTHAWVPEYLAACDLGYLYCLDDHLWAVSDAVDPHLAAFFQHPETAATLDAYVLGARAAVVMSKRLGEVIVERLPGTRLEYLHPPFDTERANALLAQEAQRKRDDGVVRIGYPTSRRPGVAPLLDRVVRHVVARYGRRVAFEFIGWMPDVLIGVSGVELLAHVGDYDRYLSVKIARHWDIGLAPLAGGLFDACKTSLKYREYGGCSIAGIYGNVAPYTDDVIDGITGVLAEPSVDAWVDALERLIESPTLRASIAANAHADVQARFSQRRSAQRWREIADKYANA